MKTKLKDGASLIAHERRRQILNEGFDSNHDAGHRDQSLAVAGACYALTGDLCDKEIWDKPLLDYLWPWESQWWKPDQSRVRNLVKAGALIAAEIDRLQGTTP
jgi:hypothetical protein